MKLKTVPYQKPEVWLPKLSALEKGVDSDGRFIGPDLELEALGESYVATKKLGSGNLLPSTFERFVGQHAPRPAAKIWIRSWCCIIKAMVKHELRWNREGDANVA